MKYIHKIKKMIAVALAASLVGSTAVFSSIAVSAVDEDNVSSENQEYSFEYIEIDENSVEIISVSENVSDIIIPEHIDGKNVVSIAADAFAENSLITSVIISGTVETIGSGAFYGCSSLTSVKMEEGIKSIESDAFSGCISLEDIDFPSTLESIGEDAFANTEWYETKDDGYIYAGLVFYKYKGQMSGYMYLPLGEGTSAIADGAFKNCDKMLSLTIPSTLKYIGNHAFDGCETILSINVSANNEVYSSNDGVVFSKDGKELIFCPPSKGALVNSRITFDKSYTVPSEVKFINPFAFDGCKYLENIILSEEIEEIGGGAFYGCSSLKSITIPSGVSFIGEGVFFGCADLEEITLPENITKISDSIFAECSSLSSIEIKGDITEICGNAFYGCSSLSEINVPESVERLGENAFADTAWFDEQEDGIVYAGKFAYTYKGEMPENTIITLDENCTAIADGAFEDFENLSEIELTENITSIGNYSFSNSGITSLTIPESVKSIGYNAFEDCSSLESIYVTSDISEIGEDIFVGCSKLKIFGEKDTEIAKYAAENGTAFTAVTKITDEETGIYAEDIQDDGTILNIVKDDSEEAVKYTISLVKDGKEVKQAMETTVGIPCSDQTLKLVKLDENGEKIFISAEYSDGIYIFKTDDISGTYILDNSGIFGDTNDDGIVDIADALLISRYDAGLVNLDSRQLAVSDVNNDGIVDIADALLISRYDAGLTSL